MKTDKNGSNVRYDWNGDGRHDKDNLEFHIHELAGTGASAHSLLSFQKAGGELTAADLIEFAKGGNKVAVSDLERFQGQGGTLSGKDVVALAEAGCGFDQEDISRLEPLNGAGFSAEDKAALAALGIKSPGQGDDAAGKGAIPEGTTCKQLLDMLDAGVKINVKDIFAYADAHPEVGKEIYMAATKNILDFKFQWGDDRDYGKVVAGLVDKGARIGKEDVFALQEQRHCFAGWNLADLCEDSSLRLTAEDLMRLHGEMACNGFDKKNLERLMDECHFTLTPTQYAALTK